MFRSGILLLALGAASADICLRVVTGASPADRGDLDVLVNGERIAHGFHNKNAVVVDECSFPDDATFAVRNPFNRAWTGSIEASTDGGVSYLPMRCPYCEAGKQAVRVVGGQQPLFTDRIVVDKSTDGENQASTRCLHGEECTLLIGLEAETNNAAGASFVPFTAVNTDTLAFTDQNFPFAQVGAYEQSCLYLQQPNSEKNVPASEVQTIITTPLHTTVYIELKADQEQQGFSVWGQKDGWALADDIVANTLVKVYKKDFSAGTIELYGNDGQGADTYTVVVCPKPATTPVPKYQECPLVEPAAAAACLPVAQAVMVAKCDTPGLEAGDLCEGDGSCNTNDHLDNCDSLDLYRVTGACPLLDPLAAGACFKNDFGGVATAEMLPTCDTPGLKVGEFCEGEGECQTDVNLNNCDTLDVYQVVAGECPLLEAVTPAQCPEDSDLVNCAAPGLKAGDLCEGDGECDTDNSLNNCGNEHDVYRVIAPEECPSPCVCNLDFAPVCGSEGKTYSNECAFDVANCKLGYSLESTEGICEEGVVPEDNIFSKQDQVLLYEGNYCSDAIVGSLAIPATTKSSLGAISGKLYQSSLTNDAIRSLRIVGPVAAGASVLVANDRFVFYREDYTTITVLEAIPAGLSYCVPSFEQTYSTDLVQVINNDHAASGIDGEVRRFQLDVTLPVSWASKVVRGQAWTQTFSEEGDATSEYFSNGPVLAVECSGEDCDSKRLLQAKESSCRYGVDIGLKHYKKIIWSEWVSGENSSAACELDHFVGRVQCRGENCAEMRAACVPMHDNCSLENYGDAKVSGFCPIGTVATGIQCRDGECAKPLLQCKSLRYDDLA